MKIIRIATNNEITVHEFPEGSFSEQNMELMRLIGPECDLLEIVHPRRLYQELGASNQIGSQPGSSVSMLVDEEGFYHHPAINPIGSYLYETARHGQPIVGNALIIGEHLTEDGAEFCGISEDQFEILYPRLEQLAKRMKNPAPQRRVEQKPEPKGPKL